MIVGAKNPLARLLPHYLTFVAIAEGICYVLTGRLW